MAGACDASEQVLGNDRSRFVLEFFEFGRNARDRAREVAGAIRPVESRQNAHTLLDARALIVVQGREGLSRSFVRQQVDHDRTRTGC